MSEQNVRQSSAPDGRKVHPPVATTSCAVEYISNALTHGELRMKEACKELGWSFPRIRSRALTIAKKLNSTIVKTSRGVYVLEPITETVETPAEATENPTTADSAVVTSDSVISEDAEPTLDPAKVEAALLGDNDPTPSV